SDVVYLAIGAAVILVLRTEPDGVAVSPLLSSPDVLQDIGFEQYSRGILGFESNLGVENYSQESGIADPPGHRLEQMIATDFDISRSCAGAGASKADRRT